MKTITSEKIPIKVWTDFVEEGALIQAKNLANLSFARFHIAIMPDVHVGYGMPIGGVLATEKVIIPNAVGVDIGCGMCTVKTSLKEIDQKTLKKILEQIRRVIPLGFEHQQKKQDLKYMPKFNLTDKHITGREFERAREQIGTLGGGNHFIEIQKGTDGNIWLMIHSGSRNFGLQVANYYNNLAKKLNEKWKDYQPVDWQLSYLPVDSEEGQNYIQEMNYCVDFAYSNRKLMMEKVKKIVFELTGASFDPMINIAHNYARQETHFGKKVFVHRKGATLANKDTIGIIPGSQGSESFIVQGLGNKDSFESCAHGAGRKMGRNQARRTLSFEEERKRLENQGILHAIRSPGDLDEAAGAYKDIHKIIEEQKDLVKPLVKLKPLAVVKG